MAARQALPWTVSVGGRRVLRGVAASIVGGTFLAHYLPHTWFIDKTQEVTQAYRQGLSIPVPQSVTQLVREVMEEMGMEEEARRRIKLYTSVGFEFFRAGSSHSSHGALLGVPMSLKWETVADFDPTGIVVNNAPVPWSTPGGERLKNSLILSRDAKKFAVARELHGIESDPVVSRALVPSVALSIAYIIALGINRRLNLYARPRSLRLCLYGLTSAFGYAVYILGVDMGNVRTEADGDEAVGKMGKAYAAGGVEFYEKILERNSALRQLMGKDGEALFTVMGNDEVLIRTRHLPYTMRLDYMKKQVTKYEEAAADGKGRLADGTGS